MYKTNNTLLIAMLIVALSGCAATEVKPDLPPTTTVRNQLVLVTVPETFFEIPDNVPSLDTSKATQREVADWVVQNEKRTNELENKILGLRQMFVKTYDLLKSSTENVIVIDTTKSDEFNKKTIEEAVKKPIIVPSAPKEETPKTDTGLVSTIKGWFSSTPKPEETAPVEVKPVN